MSAAAHTTPPDHDQRRRAVTLFDRNLVVTAGAGTGKTALLVERALNLIGTAVLPIRSLAAITFTEKAAAELRQRLATGLDELRGLAARVAAAGAPTAGVPAEISLPDSEAGRSCAWLVREAGVAPRTVEARALAALGDLDAASVSTIHAFCADILRRYPRRAGVDPGFAIDQGAIFDRLFDDEWERFLEEELGGGGGRADLWRGVLRRPGSLDDVRAIARAIASFAFAPGAGRGSQASPALQSALRDTLRPVRDDLRRILKAEAGMNPNMRRFLEQAALLLDAAADGPAAMRRAAEDEDLSAFIAKPDIAPGKKLSGADPREVERVKKLSQRWVKSLQQVDDAAIELLLQAAAPLAERCRERLLAAGFVSFDALLRLTRDLLAHHPAVRRAVASRHRALLLDEFQDTDPLQYEIVFFIAEAEGAAAPGAFDALLQPGRLFIVGDPKQSIYRFRGADIEAYRRAVDRLLACGGERLALSASFRSAAAVLRPLNRMFAAWMQDGTAGGGPGQVPYEPIEAVRPAQEEDGVVVWSIAAEGGAEERRRAEAQAIAAWIAAHAGPHAAAARRIAFRDVALLLRALTNAGLYADALRRAGIPYVVEGDRSFYERREVGDLIAFLRAVSDANDGPSLLAVLRGPLGAVPDEELARFARAGGRLDRPGAAPEDLAAYPNLARALAHLRAFRDRVAGRAADDVVREALAATPLTLLHASTFEGAQRTANLRKLAARAAEYARQGLSLQETLQAIETEFQGERAEGESPLADETIDAVRLLSVHRAKGLEYPVVFLPDLGRGHGRAPDAAGTSVARYGAAGEIAAVRLAGGPLSLARVLQEEENRRQDAAEEQRVFYVACTRAAGRLVLVNSLVGRAAPWRDALRHLGYDAREAMPADGPLHEGAMHRSVPPPPAAEPRPGSPPRSWSAVARSFSATAAAARAGAVAMLRWPAGVADARAAPGGDEEDGAPIPPHPAGGDAEAARAAGTAVHAALERWDFQVAERLRALLDEEIRRVASEGGPGAADRARGAARIAGEVVDQFLATGLPTRLAGAAILGREVPILWRDDAGATWIGACDLVYRDAAGATVAVDYKTDRLEQDPERAAERYRPQMEVYLEALRRALPGTPVRGEILFLRSGAVAPIA
jgi:ATP-dependent helicase/nuclease subunit A